MNTDRMYEHEIDRWENEGGSLQHRETNVVNPFFLQPRSWIEKKKKRHDGECRPTNQRLRRSVCS